MDLFNFYFPIIESEINILLVFIIGLATGVISGMFGLGGGVVIVPFLSLFGIPITTAIATSVNQMTASTLAAFMTYSRLKRVDYKLSGLLSVGGCIGIVIGYSLVKLAESYGNLETTISLCYIMFLSSVMFLTLKDALRIVKGKPKPTHTPKALEVLPFRIHLKSFNSKVSIVPFILVGMISGILMILLGVGGGLIMIPIMIYSLRMGEFYLTGTIQVGMFFCSIIATFLYSLKITQIDIVLSAILILGAVIGARKGALISSKLSARNFRILLTILLITISSIMLKNLLITPEQLYHVEEIRK